jgi:hypothetical protein
MTEAITAVRVNLTGLTTSSKVLHVPRFTLRLLSVITNLFPSEAENIPVDKKNCFQMVQYLLLMEKQYFGVAMIDLCRLAYELIRKILNPFSQKNRNSRED